MAFQHPPAQQPALKETSLPQAAFSQAAPGFIRTCERATVGARLGWSAAAY